MIKYKNRYGDEFTFTKDDNGDILWEGNFEYCRIGLPNDYTEAFNKYVNDGGTLSLKEFKSVVHESSEHNKYNMLVKSITDQINMVDPSGGPYISVGYKMESFGKELKGLAADSFEWIGTGYKIITKKLT